MNQETVRTSRVDGNLRALGICWVLYGVIRLVMALAMIFLSGTATVMFGALLVRVPDPFSWMSWFHAFYGLAIAVAVVAGVLGILGGLALLSGSASSRILLLAASFLSLCEIPLGLTLGAYTLVAFFARERVSVREA